MHRQTEPKRIVHPFKPVYDENSTILILGSLPSVKSRENNFYYGHPQNRFWKIISILTNSEMPVTITDKTKMLLEKGIALWDVVQSCDIVGSNDSTIDNAVPNDLSDIISNSRITRIYTNGKRADALYCKLCESRTGLKSICLPSTSPANAAWNLDSLIKAWGFILPRYTGNPC